MPEKLMAGNACVMAAILASEMGRIAGPPRPPLDTNPSTLISNSSVSGSITGMEGNVFDDTMASAPPRMHAPASITMSEVLGVSLVHTGTRATSFTASVTTEQSPWSRPMFEPMSFRSMCGQEKLSSSPSAPFSWQAVASVCQARSSLSLPEPAMIDAMSTFVGCAALMRRRRGSHQSSVLSEMSSQFHDEWSAAPSRFFIETRASSGAVRMNFAFAPYTFTTGCSPMVLVTTPPQPASKARMMLLSDSVGGADERRKGFSNVMPVKFTERFAMEISSGLPVHSGPWSRYQPARRTVASAQEFQSLPGKYGAALNIAPRRRVRSPWLAVDVAAPQNSSRYL